MAALARRLIFLLGFNINNNVTVPQQQQASALEILVNQSNAEPREYIFANRYVPVNISDSWLTMNPKQATVTILAIIVCTSILGYVYYAFMFSSPSSPSLGATDGSPRELRVFVASSLFNVVQNTSLNFEEKNNCKIIFNVGSSSSLYQQIAFGSPCDIFMSADFKWTKQLYSSGQLYGIYNNMTTNALEVLLPKDNPKNITSLLDLVKPGVKIVIADPAIPAGSYTNSTLTKIDATWGNSSSPQYLGREWQNYRTQFLSNVISYETTVEGVVGKVALGLGAVDAGVAFVSDARYGTRTGAQLQYLRIPPDVNTSGIFGIAIINGTANLELATSYMDFWLSNDGQSLLQAFGFGA